MSTAYICLTLSGHPSLQAITLSKSSRLHPMSIQSWWIKVLTGVSIYRSPCGNVTSEFILTSQIVPNITCSPYLNGLCDERQVVIQLLIWKIRFMHFIHLWITYLKKTFSGECWDICPDSVGFNFIFFLFNVITRTWHFMIDNFVSSDIKVQLYKGKSLYKTYRKTIMWKSCGIHVNRCIIWTPVNDPNVNWYRLRNWTCINIGHKCCEQTSKETIKNEQKKIDV